MGNVTSAEGITPLNVAVLPAFITDTKYNGGEEVVRKMEAKIVRHFRYPYYEAVTPEKIRKTLSASDFVIDGKMKKPYDKDAMRSVAQNLSVDIVVVMEVVKARWHIYTSFWPGGDTYEKIDVVLNCYTYSAKDDKYDKVKVSVHHDDVVGFLGGLDTVALNLTDQLLAKIPYKTIIKEE